jgi:23S rRNA pseudouridine1911/1915/1917 synthase
MSIREVRVGEDENGERLDVALSRWLDESRSHAASRIDRGEVDVDGEPAKRSHRLRAGEAVVVRPPPTEPTGAAGVSPPPVRYEDEHLLVVAKPAGLVVHPGVGRTAGTLVQALAESGYDLAPAAGEGRPGIVHRLDQGTSGLLAVAKTDAAYHGLVAALKRREVDRSYLALAEGAMPSVTGRIDAPIGRDPRERTRFAAIAEGKPAQTRWHVIRVGEVALGPDGIRVSLLECSLETGRTHQIRVHLSFAGHPVVADRTYGARRDLAARLGIDRPFLHAARLAFDHPVTGQRISVEEPLPEDLRVAGERAGVLDGTDDGA